MTVSAQAERIVRRHAAVGGLCPLIPVPFLDDAIQGRIHRRMVRQLASCQNSTLSDGVAKRLTEQPSSFLSGVGTRLVLWPVKKVVRKVVYVLAVRSCAEEAARIYHEGWLLARALEAGYVDPEGLASSEEEASRLREAILGATDEVGLSVTKRAMKSAFSLGRAGLGELVTSVRGLLGKEAKPTDLAAAEASTEPLARRMKTALDEEWNQGGALDAALRQHLER